MKTVTWTNCKIKIGEIKPWGHNVRKSDTAQRGRIQQSFDEFNQVLLFAIGPDNELYDGHQRLSTLLENHGPGHVVEARRSSRALSEKERRKLVIFLHGGAGGQFDEGKLNEWNLNEIQEWFPKDALRSQRADTALLSRILVQTPELSLGDPLEDTEIPRKNYLRKWKVKPGDIWQLDQHRIICGDCTNPAVIRELFKPKEKAMLLHADPPYGMGKQSEGVENDNLYNEKLDKFQIKWWKTCRPYLLNNGSVYIWGNPGDLWRLWYLGGLRDVEKLSLRNTIIWDKNDVKGMAWHMMTQYPPATEHCFFIQIGEQFLGNLNSDSYWAGWDEIRIPLEKEAKAAGLNPTITKEITGVGMYSHWFSKSQWQFIIEEYYKLLQEALPDHFKKPYAKLLERYQKLIVDFRKYYDGKQGGMRAYFDNSHEIMRDVWNFHRVNIREDRWDHPTPKPVEMMVRIVKTSSYAGGIVFEPFLGSGSTLIACDITGRVCRGIELSPEWVATTLERWNKITGKKPKLIARTNGKK